MPGVGVPIKSAQPGQTPWTLHVQALKFQGGYIAGGTDTTTTVPILYNSYASDQARETQTYIQVQNINIDEGVMEGCGVGSDGR